MSRAITWAELRDDAAARLRDGGVEQPAVEVGWLLEEVSGLDAAEQVAEAGAPATQRAVAALDRLVARRVGGEPLQYVLGSWSFCGIDLLVDRRVLIPRPETEVVAQVAIGEAARLGARVGKADPWSGAVTTYTVADLGTGSGALAIALAYSLPEAEVWATDVDDDALTVARANVAGSGTPSVRVRLAQGVWFDALPAELRGRLLVAVSNPPYLAESEIPALDPSVGEWEPTGALVSGATGLEAFEAIVAAAPEWLDPEGTLVLELAPHQAGPVTGLARAAGFVDVEVHEDLAGRDRVLVARLAAAPG
jgi:release factor glutamine methyltransferase